MSTFFLYKNLLKLYNYFMLLLNRKEKGDNVFFKKAKRKIVNIDGMIDEVSAKKIKIALENLVDVEKVMVDIKRKQVIVSYGNTLDEILITDTMEKNDYIVTGIKEM